MTTVLPALDLPRPAWQRDALCAQTDPELFFPTRGGSNADAKRVCAGCIARVACLDHALAHETLGVDASTAGVWGGMSRHERVNELRRRGRVPGPGRQRKAAA